MAVTRLHLIMSISLLFLLMITGLSGYLISRLISYSLPVPRSLLYITTTFPIVSGLLTAAAYQSSRATKSRQQVANRYPFYVQFFSPAITNWIVLIASTVLLTLLGAQIQPIDTVPGIQDCALEKQWLSLFKSKDSTAIRRIQDALSCCGFRSSRDMAWPFPDREHRATACELAFGRKTGCLEGWRTEERTSLASLVVCVILVGVWKISIHYFLPRQTSWTQGVHANRLTGDHALEDDRRGGAIEGPVEEVDDYSTDVGPYSDRVENEAGDTRSSVEIIPRS